MTINARLEFTRLEVPLNGYYRLHNCATDADCWFQVGPSLMRIIFRKREHELTLRLFPETHPGLHIIAISSAPLGGNKL